MLCLVFAGLGRIPLENHRTILAALSRQGLAHPAIAGAAGRLPAKLRE